MQPGFVVSEEPFSVLQMGLFGSTAGNKFCKVANAIANKPADFDKRQFVATGRAPNSKSISLKAENDCSLRLI
ncbi:hypothetical protein D3C80_2069290 [compost metagenome]